jgi:hypothetical protein
MIKSGLSFFALCLGLAHGQVASDVKAPKLYDIADSSCDPEGPGVFISQ